MRSRPLVVSLCVLALAGCQTLGGQQPSTATGPTQTPAQPPPPTPWEIARQHGMIFRGTGSTPDWSVEVKKSRPPTVFVVLDKPQRKLTAANAAVSSNPDDGMVTFQGNAGDGTPIKLIIHRGQCQQDMTGRKAAAAVLLYVGTQKYAGCGRFLLHQPSGS